MSPLDFGSIPSLCLLAQSYSERSVPLVVPGQHSLRSWKRRRERESTQSEKKRDWWTDGGGKLGLDAEGGMEKKRGRSFQSGSGDPVPSLLVCVWRGAAVKSIVARGLRVARPREINMHLWGCYLTLHACTQRLAPTHALIKILVEQLIAMINSSCFANCVIFPHDFYFWLFPPVSQMLEFTPIFHLLSH